MIAFVGSVFSPYYRRAFRRDPMTDPLQHCAINVALYGDARRWTMTERAARHVQRSASAFVVGPSCVRWDGGALCLDLDEVGMPWPRRVRGRVRIWPHGLARWRTTLDAGGAHRWGPITPCARAEVELDAPALRWQGEAYVDSNDGDEPIERPFADWDWSRATLADGSTAVIYDVRERGDAGRVIAQRFATHGQTEAFEPPPRQRLPRTGWRVARPASRGAGFISTRGRQRAMTWSTPRDGCREFCRADQAWRCGSASAKGRATTKQRGE